MKCLIKISEKHAVNPFYVQSVSESDCGSEVIVKVGKLGGTMGCSTFKSAHNLRKTIELLNGIEY